MNALVCALNSYEFNQVGNCEIAKQIGDLLEINHKGKNQVKESKDNLVSHQYELFTMESDETIKDIFLDSVTL